MHVSGHPHGRVIAEFAVRLHIEDKILVSNNKTVVFK